MKLPSITDSRGNPSQTLFWVSLALTTLLGRFVAGIFTGIGQIEATEFATAFSVILAPYIAREGIEKLTANPSGFQRNPNDPSEFKLPPGA